MEFCSVILFDYYHCINSILMLYRWRLFEILCRNIKIEKKTLKLCSILSKKKAT